ncbi:C39 family peptidase [Arthrospira platensis]|jgi:uncharacterized protein YvpB|uniref:Peptidoglycan-binding domain 1 protein n=1 Tax=Limnospira platensis NIES-46 TaxID=1236695 RepID=A0A5M3T686_LIMPL|nr:C39 family peptidase [Arthrospira platensis]AMW28115.1 peptidoglycan-binding protein [Arthrospira platensis YZ]KDR57250.1 peptidoglycan-binding protein [Arthrospira platensis str. Paraca]MBD2670899.1 C39 family peptidase [Arthrospira platensis FACHB-439]MBD2711728.1 C39 family peptidase [Arthrospira platensis FACHB-835]MDF2209235.1 C39 family peptidase [Arthrospira platensis NCB002]MDT9184362.1 C39 family peptidase [Limnospira sp. PMC 289.06]MDT9296521.1 C39 family peptidase [Arthrospira 
MKLQDIINTDKRYDVKDIAEDEELTRQIQNILVSFNLLDPPVDGIYGPKSNAAMHRFQTLLECQESGFLGTITAQKLLTTKPEDIRTDIPILKITRDTILKLRPVDSAQLNESEKQGAKAGQEFQLLAFEPDRNHIRVALRSETFKQHSIWYIFDKHGEIYQGKKLVYPKLLPAEVRLRNFPYFSQLDNWFNPTGSCNVTSIAMCLSYYGARRRVSYGQFEDELYEYALNKGYSRHSPQDLAKIVREYGCKDYFTTNATIDDVKEWLAEGKPTVIHGYFTSFGHIMPVVGYNSSGLIVHDPYGEWFSSGYRTDLSGAYLTYSYSLIRRLCLPDGNFWVHFIAP